MEWQTSSLEWVSTNLFSLSCLFTQDFEQSHQRAPFEHIRTCHFLSNPSGWLSGLDKATIPRTTQQPHSLTNRISPQSAACPLPSSLQPGCCLNAPGMIQPPELAVPSAKNALPQMFSCLVVPFPSSSFPWKVPIWARASLTSVLKWVSHTHTLPAPSSLFSVSVALTTRWYTV